MCAVRLCEWVDLIRDEKRCKSSFLWLRNVFYTQTFFFCNFCRIRHLFGLVFFLLRSLANATTTAFQACVRARFGVCDYTNEWNDIAACVEYQSGINFLARIIWPIFRLVQCCLFRLRICMCLRPAAIQLLSPTFICLLFFFSRRMLFADLFAYTMLWFIVCLTNNGCRKTYANNHTHTHTQNSIIILYFYLRFSDIFFSLFLLRTIPTWWVVGVGTWIS